MKLIPSQGMPGDIYSALSKLRENGILASSTSDYANIPRYGSAARQIKRGIWIHLNHQYNDAVLLLGDPNHRVETALTPEEMRCIEAEAKSEFYGASGRFFHYIGVGFFYFAMLCIVVIFTVKIIQS